MFISQQKCNFELLLNIICKRWLVTWLAGWFVGDHSLLKEFGLNGINI
jgi:hypothetical protein